MSIGWFIESCKANDIADCKKFCVYNNALNSVKTPKKKAREEKPANVSTNISFKSYESEINDCLAQYIAQEKNIENTDSLRTKSEAKNVIEKKQVLKENNSNSTVSATKAQASETKKDATLFKNKNFEVIGFEESDEDDLKSVIVAKGGNIIDVNDDDTYGYSSADFTLFPLTLNETTSAKAPVTLFWLQKCIESNRIVPVNECVLYQPIPRFNQDTPLQDCVICVSGYVQQERTMITSLCELLGAKTQTAFSCKPADNILKNTHLICKTAEGPKYKAAKDWNIPAVAVEWLVESCVYGVKADERKYTIDSQASYEDFVVTVDKMRRNLLDNDESNDTAGTMHTSTLIEIREFYAKTPKLNADNQNNESKRSPKDSGSINRSESKKPRLSDDNEKGFNLDEFRQPQLDRSLNEFSKPQAQAPYQFKTPTPISKPTVEIFQTPPCNKRLIELKKTDCSAPTSSNGSTPQSQDSSIYVSDYPTPVWLKDRETRDKFDYRINLDADYINNYLASIETPKKPGELPQTPIQQVLYRNMSKLAENMKKPGFFDEPESPQVVLSFERERMKQRLNEIKHFNAETDDYISATPLDVKELKTILKDVKVFVTKKLIKNQVELNAIIESLGRYLVTFFSILFAMTFFSLKLGGDLMWTYNRSCTHVVFTGKSNDTNKEYRLAKEHNKLVVSPYWLYACQEQKAHVDESLYPCTYNPSKLPVVSARTPRASSNNPNANGFLASAKMNSTPVSNSITLNQPQASQLSARRAISSKQNIIKSYVSDEEDANNEDSLIEANRVNLGLVKKKTSADTQGQSRMTDERTLIQSVVNTQKLNSIDNDSEMNLIDSKLLQQCDRQCDNVLFKNNVDAPDSIDLKMDFLDQLKHKLENISTKNLNTSQTSLLNEQQALNELNKSKSKWGNSMNDDENESDDGLKFDMENDENTSGISIKINAESNDMTSKGNASAKQYNRQTSKKRQGLVNNKEFNDELEGDKNSLYFAQSQIQVTLWNDNDTSKKNSSKKDSDRYYKS